jgi:hypothetical protein
VRRSHEPLQLLTVTIIDDAARKPSSEKVGEWAAIRGRAGVAKQGQWEINAKIRRAGGIERLRQVVFFGGEK